MRISDWSSDVCSSDLIAEGNDNYETFLRFAQTAVDSADPLNFAAAASAQHPILMLEVRGDAVVPNCTIAGDVNCPASDTILVSGYLRSAEHPSALLSLMRISYAVFCLKQK